MSHLLALDPGKSQYGWAVFKSGEYFKSGAESYTDVEDNAELFAQFGKWLGSTIRHYRITHVAVELSYPKRGKAWPPQYWGLMAILQMICKSKGLPLEQVHWNAMKTYVVKSNASKSDVLAAIQERYPQVTSEDEADAIGVGLVALEI